jgi:hypothetical protein
MPDGFDAAFTDQQMADLLAWIHAGLEGRAPAWPP